MQSTLATLLGESLSSFSKLFIENIQHEELMAWMDLYPAQIIGIVSMCGGAVQWNLGFEYLAIQEKLVQTPLTDRWYLTMTDALHCRRGVNSFGPAETGKTESVKALGHQLGRFVLVLSNDTKH
ncbi:hypothetical protein niasHT_035486 [Heterodera trifolii]|uniref:Dynein heavy chain hydrolytic ATP-binding dynein motor region domain-containing protein n=1 Tax=Heterodera trifolii TaxID=157864 RepID=A0ABD2IHX1_9BILA